MIDLHNDEVIMKRFVLIVEYGTGEVAMLTDTPELSKALEEFESRRVIGAPDSKDFWVPPVIKAKILPLWHKSVYED